MLVTLPGMMALVRATQFWKALLPMVATPAGRVTLVRPVQLREASLPMLLTLAVRVTLVKVGAFKEGIIVDGDDAGGNGVTSGYASGRRS